MENCPHLIPDENNNCETCGVPYPDPQNFPEPNLGDVMGICKLINETRDVFDGMVKANTDPKNPKLTRMRLVGGILMRLPDKMVCKGVFGASFLKAKSIGYKGTQERWTEMILEDIPTMIPANPVL